MSDSRIWSVDRIAANNLFADLGIKADDRQLASAAEHFARHRGDAQDWAAERVHVNIMENLAAATGDLSQDRDDAWMDGYLYAEQSVITLSQEELLGMMPEHRPTKGQVLRSMLRHARAKAQVA